MVETVAGSYEGLPLGDQARGFGVREGNREKERKGREGNRQRIEDRVNTCICT